MDITELFSELMPPFIKRRSASTLLNSKIYPYGSDQLKVQTEIQSKTWCVLSPSVFKNEGGSVTVKDLKVALEDEWRKIADNFLKSLIDSMSSRIGKVISHKRDHTSC